MPVALLSDPTFDLPLVLTGATTAVLVWWSLRRAAPLPSLTPTPLAPPWGYRPESFAFASLEAGRYHRTVFALWHRLAAVARERFRVRIDQPADLRDLAFADALPEPLTPRRLVRSLTRAYASTRRAEQPDWLAERWDWVRRYRDRRASQDFSRVVAELEVALPALEGR